MRATIPNEIPYFTKTHIFKADPIVIEKLKEVNKLLKNDKLQSQLPSLLEIQSSINL